MVSPIGKSSSFKEEERSKPKEKVMEPVPSQSVPLKEETAKTAAPEEEKTTASKEILVQDTSPEEEEQPNPVERTTAFTQDEDAAPRDTDGFLPTKTSKKTTSNDDAGASTEGDATSTEDVEALALELLQQEVRATRAIQQEPVAVLENGMSRSPLYFDHNG
jgi:hypothetical protein